MPFILLRCTAILAWVLLKSRMAHHKTLDAILTIVVAWAVLFGVPFFVPQIVQWALQIGIVTTVVLFVFAVVYFYPTKEAVQETSLNQVEVKLPDTMEQERIALEKKLSVYSPIHTMIVAVGTASPREASFGPSAGIGIGRFVRLDDIPNLDKVRAVFSGHADVLGDHHLKEWLKLDNLIKKDSRGGFWVGKREWEWFDELEKEYQDAAKASLSHRVRLENEQSTPTPFRGVQLEPQVEVEQDDLPPIVEREYDTATLKFKIWSNTDWIEIGLKSSTHVTIKNHNLSKGTVVPIEESDSSYLRIDNPDQEVSVIAAFEVYSGPLFVFLRKGDIGTLRVDVLNKNDKLLFRMPEYGKTSQKCNYKDFGFEFSDWG